MQRERHLVRILSAVIALTSSIGCSNRPTESTKGLRLDLDRKNPGPFVAYYFGGLASRGGSDPFRAGIVSESDGDFFVDTTALYARFRPSQKLRDLNHDGTLDWDELSPFLEATYYRRRGVPADLDSLNLPSDPAYWFELTVDGVMTTATRRIHVPVHAIRNALSQYRTTGNRIVYPEGTTIFADHVLNDRVVETTVMRKRGDGYWDFGVYDSTGARIAATTTPPKHLRVPTQCAGCHLGSRLYEPEKSFPGAARPGPEGPRAVHWDRPLPSPDLVGHFDEHRKRSDGILGLYGTLYVSELLSERARGTISEDDDKILESLGL